MSSISFDYLTIRVSQTTIIKTGLRLSWPLRLRGVVVLLGLLVLVTRTQRVVDRDMRFEISSFYRQGSESGRFRVRLKRNNDVSFSLRPLIWRSNRLNTIMFGWCKVGNSWTVDMCGEISMDCRFISVIILLRRWVTTTIGNILVFVQSREDVYSMFKKIGRNLLQVRRRSTQYEGETIRDWIHYSIFYLMVIVTI